MSGSVCEGVKDSVFQFFRSFLFVLQSDDCDVLQGFELPGAQCLQFDGALCFACVYLNDGVSVLAV